MGYSKPSGNGLLLSKEERVENARKSLLNVKPNNKGKNKGNTTPMKQVNSSGFLGSFSTVGNEPSFPVARYLSLFFNSLFGFLSIQ